MKTQNPLIGRAKGSAGGMTACKMYDKNVLKAKAFEVSNPRTQAQTTQRNFFKSVQSFAKQFDDEQLKCMFPQKPKSMSRRAMLSQQLAEYSTTSGNVKKINFTDLVSLGNASTADLPAGTLAYDETSDKWQVSGLGSGSWVAGHQSEYPVFVCINETIGEIRMLNAASPFSTTTQPLTALSDWDEDDVCHVIVLNSGMTTAQTGFGSFIIKTRKAKTGRNQSAS